MEEKKYILATAKRNNVIFELSLEKGVCEVAV